MSIIRNTRRGLQKLLRGTGPTEVSDDTKDRPSIDLFDRSPEGIEEDTEMMESLRNQSVMVTGAGGSIGSALCHKIIR